MTTLAGALANTLAAAHEGRAVLLVAPLRREARETLGDLERMFTDLGVGCTVHRTNGRERITFPSGGSIAIAGLRSIGSVRGLDLDLVYLDGVTLDDGAVSAIRPALFARNGVIVP